jgi:hypothetical protein
MRGLGTMLIAALLAACSSSPPMPAANGEAVEAAVAHAEREAAKAKSGAFDKPYEQTARRTGPSGRSSAAS